jgi:hypothetical protein
MKPFVRDFVFDEIGPDIFEVCSDSMSAQVSGRKS